MRRERVWKGGVKICGVTSVADALAAVDAGADAIGLNFVLTSARCISEATADEIRAAVPLEFPLIGVFADSPLSIVSQIVGQRNLDYTQLHGSEGADGGWSGPLIRAVRVRSPTDLAQLPSWSDAAVILLDGAGRGGATFDWSLITQARRLTSRPIVIAGGLTPDNVSAAIHATRPFAVDVASGVESSPGKKDPKLMQTFVARARAAFEELH